MGESSHSESSHNEDYSHDTTYVVIACIIFAVMSFTFLFPCNKFIPLDRRTVGVVCSLACYLTRAFGFPSRRMDLISAIDFDVLLLLASIMIVNHIVVHLKETRRIIVYFQEIVQKDPRLGFWTISLVAFSVSPFLTNDGMCLLLVEPILMAFEKTNNDDTIEEVLENNDKNKKFELRREDALYFLLALACSTNIGSALTYTGNPQNMIVASVAIDIMPSYKFLIYMLLPSLVTWFGTLFWIEYTWKKSRKNYSLASLQELPSIEANSPNESISSPTKKLFDCIEAQPTNPPPLSPRRRLAREKEKLVKKVVKTVFSPAPFVIIAMLLLMVIMIFVDVMPISALICVAAIAMVLVVVFGNYWQNNFLWEEEVEIASRSSRSRKLRRRVGSKASIELSNISNHSNTKNSLHSRQLSNVSNGNNKEINYMQIQSSNKEVINSNLSEDGSLGPPTFEDRVDNLNQFFDDLFDSIDYSLLLIFLGTFIVVENMASTGVPKNIWNSIVGDKPFRSFGSVFNISLFILVASQLLGNVAVIQLAKPNVESLEDEESRRYAWSMISFIATIGGNLTITGSAANIIVAEKANRMDATLNVDFFRHFWVCFFITLASCFVSGALLSGIVLADNANGSNW